MFDEAMRNGQPIKDDDEVLAQQSPTKHPIRQVVVLDAHIRAVREAETY
jgi:hypothetical protein